MLLGQALILCVLAANCCATINLVKDLLQFNVAGHPVVHKDVEYLFDPNIGVERSRFYQEVNGVYGEKAIERLGLGIDGKENERLQQQKIRDIYLEQNLPVV
ncbi:hypothetical protein PPYR_00855 [Photinus pyralis]|uniref:Uncharacterized protein n=1 Tax=Photinus pyralis TaxID=7054 RepID=A0A1Y1MH11_PHOPY|nr:hypothetical protein PPYR_00855 [Photinus pyralis]